VTATLLAQAAYGAASIPVRTDRGNELGAFETITARLARAAEPGAAMGLRAAALHDNRRLWTALATDLAGAGNGLPGPLRAQLFYLAEFSLLQSRAALRDPAALAALIDINRAVMRGLSGMADAT
jgi:flagellar biosynthesis activator protein FlaF